MKKKNNRISRYNHVEMYGNTRLDRIRNGYWRGSLEVAPIAGIIRENRFR